MNICCSSCWKTWEENRTVSQLQPWTQHSGERPPPPPPAQPPPRILLTPPLRFPYAGSPSPLWTIKVRFNVYYVLNKLMHLLNLFTLPLKGLTNFLIYISFRSRMSQLQMLKTIFILIFTLSCCVSDRYNTKKGCHATMFKIYYSWLKSPNYIPFLLKIKKNNSQKFLHYLIIISY